MIASASSKGALQLVYSRLWIFFLPDHLFLYGRLKRSWSLPYPTAERYIDELVKQGILESSGKARNRVFVARDILNAVEETKIVGR